MPWQLLLACLCSLGVLATGRLAAAEEGVVAGVLVQADGGAAVAGAKVLLVGGRLYQAQSDAEGRFRMESIPPGEYRIWAHRENLVSQKVSLRNMEAAEAKGPMFAPLRLPMAAGKQVRFSVASAVTNKQVAGAVIRFGYPDRRKETTAADGTATVSGLLPEAYEITVEASGHARSLRHLDLSQFGAVTELAVPLLAGGVVHGVVTDDKGQPLAGVDVVFREPGSSSGFYGEAPRTDATGRFRHNYLPLNASIEVSFSKDGYLFQRREAGLSESMREQQLDIQLERLPPGGSIAGVVKDIEGKPVEGAIVSNYGSGSRQERTTTTDEQGAFVLHDLLKAYNGHEIIVRAKGLAPWRQAVKPGTPDKPAAVNVTLQPGHFIKGQVVDEQGKPIARATVAVNGHRFPGRIGDHLQTDAEGRFRFDSLPEISKFDIYTTGYSGQREVSLPLDGEEVVTVVLEPMGVIGGRVVDAVTGLPIHQFNVRIGFSRQQFEGDVRGTYSSKLSEGVAFKSVEGRFMLKEITNRMALEVIVEAEGYERSVLPRVVALSPDKTQPVEVALQRLDPSRLFTLQGQLVDHEGRGVAGAQLRLIVSSQPPKGYNDNDYNWILVKTGQLARRGHVDQFLQLVSDGEGRFEFKHVLPEKHLQLCFWGNNAVQGRTLELEKTAPGAKQTITVELPKPATISGTIKLAAFPNVGRIRLTRPQEAWHEYEQDLEEGQTKFRFENLPPGEYLIVVQSKPVRNPESEGSSTLYGLAQQKLQLKEGETKLVHFAVAERVVP
jgi:hypothetical protein